MSWLDLTEDKIKEFLAEDLYPSIRSVHALEDGTVRRLRAECRTGYLNVVGHNLHDECCPNFIRSPPKLESDIDFDYHPVSPSEFLGTGKTGRRAVMWFLNDLTEIMSYGGELINKDGEAIRPGRRKPIEATPIQSPIVVEKRTGGDLVGFAHWEEGSAFFSSWGHPSTERESPVDEQSRPHGKEHHFSLDIVTKNHLFYRFDIEQYIVNIFGIWEHMHRLGFNLDRDGLSEPTNSRGVMGSVGLDTAKASIIIQDYSRLVNGNKVILRATREPTRGISFTVADKTDKATGEWNPRDRFSGMPVHLRNRSAAQQLAYVINANENFLARETSFGNSLRSAVGGVYIEQTVPGLDGETMITLEQDCTGGDTCPIMGGIQFLIHDEGSCRPYRTQNLGHGADGIRHLDGRYPQCRIWDMKTWFDEWVDGQKVEWVDGEGDY